MRSVIRLVITIGVTLWVSTSGGGAALAQTTTAPAAPGPGPETKPDLLGDLTSDVELTRASIQVRRQALVTAAMDLEPKQADVFWPIYREYRSLTFAISARYS